MMQTETYGLTSTNARDQGVAFIALYHFIVAALFLMGTVALALPALILGVVAVTEAPPAAIGMLAVGFAAAICMAFTILYIAVGYGLWTMRQWARIAAMALAALMLMAFPVGTIIGALILWHLAKPEVALGFESQR